MQKYTSSVYQTTEVRHLTFFDMIQLETQHTHRRCFTYKNMTTFFKKNVIQRKKNKRPLVLNGSLSVVSVAVHCSSALCLFCINIHSRSHSCGMPLDDEKFLRSRPTADLYPFEKIYLTQPALTDISLASSVDKSTAYLLHDRYTS